MKFWLLTVDGTEILFRFKHSEVTTEEQAIAKAQEKYPNAIIKGRLAQ